MGLKSASARGACPCPAGASFIRWPTAPCRSGCTLGIPGSSSAPCGAAAGASSPPPCCSATRCRSTRPRSEATPARGSWSCRGSSPSSGATRGADLATRPWTAPRGPVGTGLDTRTIDFEIDGLRPYRNGSPASRIHWATVARTGEMVEHRLVAGADSSPLVVLDRFNPADQDALDSAVRAAASICVHLAPAGGCTLLVSGERRPLEVDSQLRAWPDVHAHLAVVEAGSAAPAIQRLSRAETIFWVTAAEAEPSWTRGMARHGWYLVTPFPLPGLAPAFTVAGCHGQHPAAARRARSVAA